MFRSIAVAAATVGLLPGHAAADSSARERYCVRLTIASPLALPRVPIDPEIDFAGLIREAGLPGVLDPNSIEVIDLVAGRPVPHARSDDFAYADKGRVAWVAGEPRSTRFEIRFQTAARRPALEPQAYVPRIGTGDLLRYNVGRPCPITLFYGLAAADLTGDGRADLVGCWNYAFRPGRPWGGPVCYPRTGPAGSP